MKQWERIPRDRMITVSERKWMRLRSLINYKLADEVRRANRELRLAQAEVYRRDYDLNRQAVLAMETNIAWMDKCNALEAELAALKQSALEMV